MGDHPLELEHTLGAGGDLRAKISEILVDVARRIAARAEDRAHFAVEEASLRDQLHVVEQDAFFVDVLRVRRHRAGGDAANVGVMASGGDIELRPSQIRGARGPLTGASRSLSPLAGRGFG